LIITKHREIFTSMKEILETCSNVSRVSLSGHQAINSEDTFASVYVIPGADSFTSRTTGTSVHSYDNSLFVRCIVNDNCIDDELNWTDTRDQIIQAVLADSEIWKQAVNRDVVSVVYDDMNNFPLVTFEILFEFSLREECN